MDTWNAYESALVLLFEEIDAITERKSSENTNGDDILVQVESLLRSMDMEARTDLTQKEYLLGKVKEHRASYTTLKLKWARWKEEHNRSALLSSSSIEQRNRILNANERVHEQNEILQRSIKTVAELNDTGNEIMNELQENSKKIKDSMQRAKELNSNLDGAQKTLKGMNSREKCCIQ